MVRLCAATHLLQHRRAALRDVPTVLRMSKHVAISPTYSQLRRTGQMVSLILHLQDVHHTCPMS